MVQFPDERRKQEFLALKDARLQSALMGLEFPFSSGLRTPEKNAEVGGVPNSGHLSGSAADIDISESLKTPEGKAKLAQTWDDLTAKGFKVLYKASDGHLHIEPTEKVSPVDEAALKQSLSVFTQKPEIPSPVPLEPGLFSGGGLGSNLGKQIEENTFQTPETSPRPFLDRLMSRQKNMGLDERALSLAGSVFPPISPLIGLPREERESITGGLAKFGKGASAGLSDPVAAGISSLLTGDEFSDVSAAQKKSSEEFSEENPLLSTGLEIGGLFSPGGALSQSIGAGSKISSKLLPGALEKGAPFLKNLLAKGVRGGAAGGLFGLANPETPIQDLPKEIALGGALDPGLGLVGAGFKKGGKAVKTVGKFLGRSLEETPFIGAPLKAGREMLRDFRADRFAGKLDDIARSGEADDAITAGTGFREKVKKIDDEIFSKYKSIKDPLIKKYGDSSASPERIRKSIVSSLDEAGVIDAKGNIDFDSPLFAGPEGANFKALTKLLDRLKENPTISEMDRLLRGIGKKANFKGANRTYADQAFGKIYGEGVEGLLDNLDDILKSSGEKSKEISGLKKSLSSTLDERAALSEKSSRIPNQDSFIANRAREKVSALDEPLKQKQEGIKSALDEKLSENVENAKQTVEQFREGRRQFSEQRPFIERLTKLGRKDPEKIVKGARSQLTGSFIQDAIKKNPAFAEPIKQAVLADIRRASKDQKSLKRIIDSYGDDALRQLFGEDYKAIEKLAGTSKSFLGKLTSKAKDTKAAKSVPTSLSPLFNYLGTQGI